jgi:hypothetical protein
MRVFLSYSYHAEDHWIEELIVPLIRAFDSTPSDGKGIQGERLSDGVKERIARSQALVAFVTKRGKAADAEGWYRTHRWVTDELAYASLIGKAVVEVREAGVDPQGGIVGDRARINYDGNNRVELLLQLTATLARWHRQIRRVQVMPTKYVSRNGQLADVGTQWLRQRATQPAFRCQYEVLDGDDLSKPIDTKLLFIEGRMYFSAATLATGARVRLHITTAEGVFMSDFENVDDVNLPITLDGPENVPADPRPRGLETVLRGEPDR